MKIRSITCFVNPARTQYEAQLDRLAALVSEARQRFQSAGYSVQTVRLATVPFPRFRKGLNAESVIQQAQALESGADRRGFTYLSLGPALPEIPESYDVIPEVLGATQNVFLSGIIATARQGVNLRAVKACGRVITRAATLSQDGFANLRFAALANVRPGGPFFPAAYHRGDQPGFALAMEAADEAVEALSDARSVSGGCQRLLEQLEEGGAELTSLARELSSRWQVKFLGIDFSLAPFPSQLCSLGHAMELLGVPRVGLSGALAAAAVLADTLDRGHWPRAGFNGMMLPVLEDATLAARSLDGSLSVQDLLLYSAVCGTGLDTVPLPGDTSPEQIAALLLDVATLAVRLKKPLTARLMPVPGKKAGERTEFHFDYFANGRILPLRAEALHGPFAQDEWIALRPRR